MPGIDRGIQLLSRINIVLAVVLLDFMLVAGPGLFIVSSWLDGLGLCFTRFFDMALYRSDAGLFGEPGWLSWWTVFFWGWFLGYGPLTAMFIARVSRGRSIRSIIILPSFVAPIATTFWFTIIGGSGLGMELANPNTIAAAFEGFNLPAAPLAITQALPLGLIVSVLFLALTIIFVATTGDSMTYVISVAVSEEKLEPRLGERHRDPEVPWEQPLDVGHAVADLGSDLERNANVDEPVSVFLRANPQHRHVVRRVQMSATRPYAEIRDNLIGADMTPVDLLRCKLAFFGATRFDPRSDRWVRICMFQNAPFPHEIGDLPSDDWAYPPATDGSA